MRQFNSITNFDDFVRIIVEYVSLFTNPLHYHEELENKFIKRQIDFNK